jgi:hypothetical protein
MRYPLALGYDPQQPPADWDPENDADECPVCGSTPQGTGCYHICPNSVAYYSPEQERADDAHYGQDHHDGWGDPDHYDPEEG